MEEEVSQLCDETLSQNVTISNKKWLLFIIRIERIVAGDFKVHMATMRIFYKFIMMCSFAIFMNYVLTEN